MLCGLTKGAIILSGQIKALISIDATLGGPDIAAGDYVVINALSARMDQKAASSDASLGIACEL